MTDDLARDLEGIAGSVPPIPNDYASLKSLIQSLPQPLPPDIRSAITGTVNATDPGLTAASQVANTLTGGSIGTESGAVIGQVSELFYGNANILRNAGMELADSTDPSIPASPTTVDWAPYWNATYVLNSGGAPTGGVGLSLGQQYSRYVMQSNPFNSAMIGVWLAGAVSGATNYTVKIENTLHWWPDFDTALPYLTAAIKMTLYGEVPQAACSVFRARLVILDSAGAEMAASDWMDWKARGAVDAWTVVRMTCAMPRPSAGWYDDAWHYRFEINYARSSTGTGTDWLIFGEPVFALSSTQSPPPYSPIIAKWEADALETTLATDGYPRLQVIVDGRDPATAKGVIWFGDGVNASDLVLYRAAAGALKIGTKNGGTADEALYIGDDSILYDVDMADRLGIKGQTDATAGGFVFGSSKKPEIYRQNDEGLTLKHDAATGLVPLIKKKSGDQQILNTNVLTNVTGVDFAVKANSVYAVRWVVVFTVDSATTDGIQLAVTGPTNCLPSLDVSIPTSSTARTFGRINALATAISTAAIDSTTARNVAIVEGIIVNGSNAGTVNLQAASDTATTGDVTIKSGTHLVLA